MLVRRLSQEFYTLHQFPSTMISNVASLFLILIDKPT